MPANAKAPARSDLSLRPLRAALITLLALALAAVCLPPWLAFAPEHSDWQWISAAPAAAPGHWLGTDAIGRDVLARTLAAGRVSLLVAASAGSLALLLGLAYGALAGTLGGLGERLMMRWLDLVSALPFLLIVVVLLTVFGRHPALLVGAIAVYVCLDLARMVRAEAARIRVLPFVESARALGAGTWWLLLRHILPNVRGFALVYLSLAVPQAILVESFLSFLGLGLDEPTVSLGTLLAEGAQEMVDAPWVLLAPTLFLITLLLALGVLGDRLREGLRERRAGAA